VKAAGHDAVIERLSCNELALYACSSGANWGSNASVKIWINQHSSGRIRPRWNGPVLKFADWPRDNAEDGLALDDDEDAPAASNEASTRRIAIESVAKCDPCMLVSARVFGDPLEYRLPGFLLLLDESSDFGRRHWM
jgi:hypothetical protein